MDLKNDISLTLSSMVSNLVRTMPSMRWGFVDSEKSARDWLNLASWSTASFPTRASPTNKTRSGSFTFISWKKRLRSPNLYTNVIVFRGNWNIILVIQYTLASSLIRGSLSCMRPAVSTRTTSIFCSRALEIASLARLAPSFSG